jgi:hypothetical protein
MTGVVPSSWGKEIPIRLLNWFGFVATGKPRVVLAQGEDDRRGELAKPIQQRHHLPSTLPRMGEVIEL